jgi:hypothetical protein
MLKENRNYDYAVFKLLIYKEYIQRERKTIERKKFSAKMRKNSPRNKPELKPE